MESILSFSPVIIGNEIVENIRITKINSAKAYLCVGFLQEKEEMWLHIGIFFAIIFSAFFTQIVEMGSQYGSSCSGRNPVGR